MSHDRRPLIDPVCFLAFAGLVLLLLSMAGCNSAQGPKFAATPVEAQAVEIERVAPLVKRVHTEVPPLLAKLPVSPETIAIGERVAALGAVVEVLEAAPVELRHADTLNAETVGQANAQIDALRDELKEAKEGQTAWVWMLGMAIAVGGIACIVFLHQPKLGGGLIATGIGLIALAEFVAWAQGYLFIIGLVGLVGVLGWVAFEAYRDREDIKRFGNIAKGAVKLAKQGKVEEAWAALRADPQVNDEFERQKRPRPPETVTTGSGLHRLTIEDAASVTEGLQ